MDLITIKHEEGLAFSVKIRGHKFLVDMPQDIGPKEAAFLRAGKNCLIHNTLEKCPEIDVAVIK